jgi:hypothetical protein
LESEDALFDVLWELGQESLIGYVECRFLSAEGMRKYVDAISREGFVVDSQVFASICRRLVAKPGAEMTESERNRFVHREAPKPAAAPGEEFAFSGSPFSGIISHLTSQFGGNVHEKGVVNITSSGDLGNNRPWHVADHAAGNIWQSRNWANSWICFEFKRHSISLKNYTLKSSLDGPGDDHPREWVVEGSKDGSTWELLDSRNTEELNGDSIVKTFNCSSAKSSEFFRFVRLRQTGKNCQGDDYFVLGAVELFGTLQNCA